jgi:regulator of RNase E activity RraA
MDASRFARFTPTTYADVITRDRVMDLGMRPLRSPMPRIAGAADPVRNVCASAQKRGVAGIVMDGAMRDAGEAAHEPAIDDPVAKLGIDA